MATFYRKTFTNFVSYSSLHGRNEGNGLQEKFKGLDGMMFVFKCDPNGRHAGHFFFYFFPCEPENFFQRYFNSSCGELTEDDGGNIRLVTKETSYEFGGEVDIPPEEKEVFELNAMEVMNAVCK